MTDASTRMSRPQSERPDIVKGFNYGVQDNEEASNVLFNMDDHNGEIGRLNTDLGQFVDKDKRAVTPLDGRPFNKTSKKDHQDDSPDRSTPYRASTGFM